MFEINAKTLKSAKTYLPMAEKIKIASEIAANCVTSIEYTVKVGNIPIDIPDWHGRNPALKDRFLLGALLKYYLGFDFTPVEGTEYLLSTDDYDRAASKHPRNAIERCKGDKEARDAAFDILADYKLLCDMAKIAVEDTIAAQNDPVARYLAAQTMAMTPEALQQLSDAEKGLRKEINKLRRTGAQAQEAIREHNEGHAEALAAIPVDPEAYAKAAEARLKRLGPEAETEAAE